MVNFFDDRYEDNGFVIKYRRDFLLDTDEDLSDLPPADVIRAGSLAYSIGSGSLYILNGSGEWVKTKAAGGGGDDPEPTPGGDLPEFSLSMDSVSVAQGSSEFLTITKTGGSADWTVGQPEYTSDDDTVAVAVADETWDAFEVRGVGAGDTNITITIPLYNESTEGEQFPSLTLSVHVD